VPLPGERVGVPVSKSSVTVVDGSEVGVGVVTTVEVGVTRIVGVGVVAGVEEVGVGKVVLEGFGVVPVLEGVGEVELPGVEVGVWAGDGEGVAVGVLLEKYHMAPAKAATAIAIRSILGQVKSFPDISTLPIRAQIILN
jgi:hypothetical protein